ncbi:hypothetical protein OPQ81_010351 [Rhizoctonia solani]|nr:hypothetical protein OPQ81_010351 [Rhizoctonia solani]
MLFVNPISPFDVTRQLTVRDTNRHKKCDETKPECMRCLASKKSCSYEYVEYPESEGHRVKRTKPAPRSTRELVAKNDLSSPFAISFTSSSTPSQSNDSTFLTRSVPLEKLSEEFYSSSDLAVPRAVADSLSLPSIPSIPPKLLSDIGLISSSLTSLDLSRVPTGVQHPCDLISNTSDSTSQVFERFGLDKDSDDDNDPEEVQTILCRGLILDKNVKENTLPFVLYCYSQWAIASVFEPLQTMYRMRDQITAQFLSENPRTRIILIANVMNMFAKQFAIDGARKSILNHLDLEAKEAVAAFMAKPPCFVPALDRQNAIRTLDNKLEILALQLDTHPTSDCIQSLESAAPVFRRACLDLPGRPINLPNLLLDLSLNLRHFATLDIIMSVVTGLPTRFQYEVPFSLELCERIYQWQLQGNYGLQWLYGFPDQFIMLFAWINTLSETPGASDDAGLISWIESQLPQIKVAIDESGDPSLRIGRMVVLESWRYTALIYLYLVLCKANADDPRVICVQKGFMRLIRGIKAGRNPDVYLLVPIGVAGMVTIDERDRNTLRQRILSVREYAERGTAGNDILLKLEDIWARTKDEGRAAVWSDMRIASSRLPRS